MICLILKTLRVCYFVQCEEKCMKQYRIKSCMYGSVLVPHKYLYFSISTL